MILKYIVATAALATALASTTALAMPISNLPELAPSMTDNVRYCRYRGCGRMYVRRYAPSYNRYYSSPYYSDYGPSYSYYGGYAPYGGYGYGGPGISLGFGFGGFGFGGGWGHRGRW